MAANGRWPPATGRSSRRIAGTASPGPTRRGKRSGWRCIWRRIWPPVDPTQRPPGPAGARLPGMSQTIPRSYALANLPRYTSYPTAPHFGPLAEATLSRLARRASRAARPALALCPYPVLPRALLVLRLPHQRAPATPTAIARYGAALRQEAAALAGALPAHAGVAAHPSRRRHAQHARRRASLRALFAALRASFAFRPGAEIAVELDPRAARRRNGRGAGAKPASPAPRLGVQDIDAGGAAPHRPAAVRGLRGRGGDAAARRRHPRASIST